jgi:hypothetical protein
MIAEVNEENLGIRAFHLRKERAVERAVEKIRHRLNSKWQALSSKDIDVLNWALGETWAMMGFYEWDRIGFSFIDLDKLNKIVTIGKEVLDHKKLGTIAFKEIHQILRSLKTLEV